MITTTTTTTTANPAAGTNRVVSFPYRFDEEEHLHVYRVTSAGARTTLTEGVHYSVAGTGDSGGGSLTIFTVTTGDTIVVSREVDITQQQDYVTNDRFPAAGTEGQLDKQIMIDQQLNNGLGRAIKVLPGEPNPVVSAQADREETIMVWDTDGNYTEDTPAQLWSRLPVPTGTISGVGMKTWPDDAARANATYAPDFVGQLGSQIDKPGITYKAESVAAGGWVASLGMTGPVIHIVLDNTRDDFEGTGTPSSPINAKGLDSLKTVIEDDTLVPPGSTVLVGPGTYILSGGAGVGIEIAKDLVMRGAGMGVTILQLESQAAKTPTSGAFYILSLDRPSTDKTIVVSDMTLDANFPTFPFDDYPGPAEVTSGGASSYALHTVYENIELINCGKFERTAEAFYLNVFNPDPARINYAEMRNCWFHDEYDTPDPGVYGGVSMHLGSGDNGHGKTSGSFINCRAERNSRGVGFGVAGPEVIYITDCTVTITDPSKEVYGILCDSAPAGVNGKLIAVRGGYYEYGPNKYAILFNADFDLGTIEGVSFHTDNTQITGQGAMQFWRGKRIVRGCTFHGTTYIDSPIVDVLQVDNTHVIVSDCVVDKIVGQTLYSYPGRYVKGSSHNRFHDGTEMWGNSPPSSLTTGIVATVPSWILYDKIDDVPDKGPFPDWAYGIIYEVGDLVTWYKQAYICILQHNSGPNREPGNIRWIPAPDPASIYDSRDWNTYWRVAQWDEIGYNLTSANNYITTADPFSVVVMPYAYKGAKVSVTNGGANSVMLAPAYLDDLGEGPGIYLELEAGSTVTFEGLQTSPILQQWDGNQALNRVTYNPYTYPVDRIVQHSGVAYRCISSVSATGLGTDPLIPGSPLAGNGWQTYWEVETEAVSWFKTVTPISTLNIILAAAAATFATTSAKQYVVGDVGGNTLTTMTAGQPGDEVTLTFDDNLVDITHGTGTDAFSLLGGANLTTIVQGSRIHLRHNGQYWVEQWRDL